MAGRTLPGSSDANTPIRKALLGGAADDSIRFMDTRSRAEDGSLGKEQPGLVTRTTDIPCFIAGVAWRVGSQ